MEPREREFSYFSHLLARGMVSLIARAPDQYICLTHDSILALSGVPSIDLNLLLLGSPDPAMTELAVDICASKGLPLLVLTASDFPLPIPGLQDFGMLPLMIKDDAPKPMTEMPIHVIRIEGPEENRIAGDLQAEAFEMDRDAVATALDASRMGASPVDGFIAYVEDQAVATLSLIRFGDCAGIWTMATSPTVQRRGYGRALLTDVLVKSHGQGVRCFFLAASTAGLPLYERMGFRTVGAFVLRGLLPSSVSPQS